MLIVGERRKKVKDDSMRVDLSGDFFHLIEVFKFFAEDD